MHKSQGTATAHFPDEMTAGLDCQIKLCTRGGEQAKEALLVSFPRVFLRNRVATVAIIVTQVKGQVERLVLLAEIW